jgi:hypothetical protein
VPDDAPGRIHDRYLYVGIFVELERYSPLAG